MDERLPVKAEGAALCSGRGAGVGARLSAGGPQMWGGARGVWGEGEVSGGVVGMWGLGGGWRGIRDDEGGLAPL